MTATPTCAERFNKIDLNRVPSAMEQRAASWARTSTGPNPYAEPPPPPAPTSAPPRGIHGGFSMLLPRSVVSAMCQHVSDKTGVALDDLTGPSRRRDAILARWAVMRAMRDRGVSLERIGLALGGRDHSTVIVGLRRFDAVMREMPEYAAIARGASQIGRRQ